VKFLIFCFDKSCETLISVKYN